MYDQVVVGSLVVLGVLRSLFVWLGMMMQLCVRTLDDCGLHVAHCGLCVGCIVSEDSVELQWHCTPNNGFLDLQFLRQAAYLVGRWGCRAAFRVLRDRVLWFPCGQCTPSWASGHFVKWSHVSGVCIWHGHMVYSGGMSTPSLLYHLATLSSWGSCSSRS